VWPRLVMPTLQAFSHDPPWQVSMHGPSGCVCVGPVTHRTQLEPRENGEEKQKCSGLFCVWRSCKSCSLCAHAPVKGAECRRAPLDTEQLCLQRGGFNPGGCPLSHSINLLCPDPHFVTCSAFYTSVSPSVISLPGAWDSRYTMAT